MNARRLTKLFHLLLASSAVSAGGAACGGAIADESGGSTGDSPGADAAIATGDDDDDADAATTTTAGRDSGAADVHADVKSDVTVPPRDAAVADAFTGCAIGELAADPTLCCVNPPDPLCGSSGGGDTDHCALDCRAVCEHAAPGSSSAHAFVDCYWSQSTTDPKIEYACGLCGVGRVPEDTPPCVSGCDLGARLAEQAYYEAASVTAFERLVRELTRVGAPASLVRRATRGVADERRHAALFARLARERGATVRRPALDATRRPGLYELALENAAEGCVRETYGALVATHQASRAEEPALRRAFAEVARDETAHAALSWDLAAWFEERLTPRELARVRAVRDEAQGRLAGELLRGGYDSADRALGLPSPEVACALFAKLFDASSGVDALGAAA